MCIILIEHKKQIKENKMKKAQKGSKALEIASEKLEDIFTVAFKKAVFDTNGKVSMDELECIAEKDLAAGIVSVKVTVYGLAGTTPKPGFYDKKADKLLAKGFNKIKAGDCSFKFDGAFDLNTNDYVLNYVAE